MASATRAAVVEISVRSLEVSVELRSRTSRTSRTTATTANTTAAAVATTAPADTPVRPAVGAAGGSGGGNISIWSSETSGSASVNGTFHHSESSGQPHHESHAE